MLLFIATGKGEAGKFSDAAQRLGPALQGKVRVPHLVGEARAVTEARAAFPPALASRPACWWGGASARCPLPTPAGKGQSLVLADVHTRVPYGTTVS